VPFIDTHCHLNDGRAFPDPAAAVAEAHAAGVAAMVAVGIDTESSRRALEIAEQHPSVFAAVGWHPNHADDFSEKELAPLEEMLAHPKALALGEIGLDYYRDHASPDAQMRCLRAQLDLAESAGAKVIFHCRDAYDDLLDVLESRAVIPYLFHCFAGSAEECARCLALGGILGVDGPVSYPKSDGLRSVLTEAPLDRLVLETDAPWMPPVPYRGKLNQPAWLPLIAQALADARGISLSEVEAATTQTAIEWFELPEQALHLPR
jgi:TatD DNase family protein